MLMLVELELGNFGCVETGEAEAAHTVWANQRFALSWQTLCPKRLNSKLRPQLFITCRLQGRPRGTERRMECDMM